MSEITIQRKPLKLAICSWCNGIGAGAARMETYYHQYYNRDLFEPHIISLVRRPEGQPEYDKSIPYIAINQQDRFSHLLKVLQDFDVIQFQGGFNPLVCKVSKYIKRPHVLLEVLHNIEPGGLYSNIDGIVGVSTAVAEDQEARDKYRTILNGIDVNLFPFSTEEKVKDKIIFLQVARRSKVAINLDQISQEILALDPAIELWIVGDQIEQSSDRIKFYNFTDNIAELYRQAHFLVLLSELEPFGLVVLESMASGTPAIVSKSGGFLDIINHGINGLFVEGPTVDNAINIFSYALDTLNNGQYQRMVLTARKDVESKFSIQNCVRQYEQFILELYQTKLTKIITDLDSPATVPADALVGEALYDFTANDLQTLSERMRTLAKSTEPIGNVMVLKIADQISQFLKMKHPDLLPRGLNLYLFLSGDKTEYICNELLSDIEFVRQNGFFDSVYKYFEETKVDYPVRWEKIQRL